MEAQADFLALGGPWRPSAARACASSSAGTAIELQMAPARSSRKVNIGMERISGSCRQGKSLTISVIGWPRAPGVFDNWSGGAIALKGARQRQPQRQLKRAPPSNEKIVATAPNQKHGRVAYANPAPGGRLSFSANTKIASAAIQERGSSSRPAHEEERPPIRSQQQRHNKRLQRALLMRAGGARGGQEG